MKRSNLLALLLSTSLCLSLLSACGGGNSASTDNSGKAANAAADAGETTLTVGIDSDMVKLDPAFSYDWSTSPVLGNITEGILDYDLEISSQLNCTLAESWEQVDNLTYVYNMRDDILFSDGTPMTMEDVMFSLERIMDPETASYLGWMFGNVDTIEQTGDWQFTVSLKTPDANWQYVLGTHAGCVLSKAHYEASGDAFGTSEAGIVGTGPYKFVSWQNGTEVKLTRNEYYRDTDNVYYDNLTFKIIPDSTTMTTALQTGDVNVCMTPSSDLLPTMQADKNLTVTTFEGFGINYLAMNNAKEPLNDARVRKAIYYALNIESIQENLLGDAATVAGQLPNSSAMYTFDTERWEEYAASIPAHEYNVEKAKALLAEAGYPDGFTIDLVHNSANTSVAVGLAIQADLAVVGIDVELRKLTSDEAVSHLFGGVLDENGLRAYDMIFSGWQADYPDPAGNIYPLYQGGNSSNSAAYDNQAVTDLILQQTAETDPSVRTDLLFEAMDLVIEDQPYVNMYYPVKALVTSADITGIVMTPNWSWNLNLQDAHPVD